MGKPTKTASGTAQTKTETPPPADQQDAADVMQWGGEGKVTGFEMTRPEDLGIPFLTILQKGSPEVDSTHKDYATKKIDGAQMGMIINSLSRDILYEPDGDPLLFVPCAHEKLWMEWRPKNEGGGIVQSHRSPGILASTKRNEDNEDELPNGNTIKTTSYFSGLAKSGDEWVRCLIGMTSTQLKKGRQWLSQMQTLKYEGRPLPMFANIWKLSTVVERNEEGSWFGWKIELDRILRRSDMKLIKEAEGIATSIVESRVALPAPGETDKSAF